MAEWIKELLVGAFNMIYPANSIWKARMSCVKMMLVTTPMDIGNGDVWSRVISELYPTFFVIGSSLLLIFLSIGFLKEITDFRKSITIELLVTYGIKLIIAEFLSDNSLTIVTPADPQIGEMLTYLAWGLVFMIVALISSFMILFAVYKRFLNLYLVILFCPIALSSMSGDRGISQTAVAWIKSFLGATFEVVVIALALLIADWMLTGGLIVFSSLEGTVAEWTVSVLEGMMTMAITAGTVKGAEGLLRRSFAL